MKKLSDKDVIERCVEIAIEGGWDGYERIFGKCPSLLRLGLNSKIWGGIMFDYGEYKQTIFDHDFCKALFGKDMIADLGGYGIEAYKFHLKELAISEDRIDYLRNWLKEQS